MLALLAPLASGDELAPGVTLVGVSTEVGFWLTLALPEGVLSVEIAPLGEGKYATRTARHGISYRAEGGRNPIDPGRGRALCQLVAAHVARNEAQVSPIVIAEHDAARVREVRVTELLEAAGQGAERFLKLSPYAGCLIGCRYCYAQRPMATLRRMEGLPEVPWGSYVDVRINAPEVLARELDRLEPVPLKFCPILSDPYQAVEARYGLTRACLQQIAAARSVWPTLLLTRSKLVTRDVDLLASLPAVWVGASIPTIEDEVRAHFEPRAASIEERLASLAVLRRAGVRTFAVVQPLLPGSVEALADALAATVSSVSIDVLRGEERATEDFDDARYRESRAEAWQAERASALAAALAARSVPVWAGELPPEQVGR